MPDQQIQPLDPRGLKILLDYYWCATGWRNRWATTATPDDLEYAKQMGFMFDPVVLTHDDIMHRAIAAVKRVNARQVANAFVFSLSNRRLDLRSALGSFAVFQHFKVHPGPDPRSGCQVCGEQLSDHRGHDLSVLNFERHKWGGVRHDQPLYAALDLELFAAIAPVTPTSRDIDILKQILSAIDAAPLKTTSTALQKHLAPILKSNKSERDKLVAILGYCGIIATPEHPGYTDRFVECRQREAPSSNFAEMKYPAVWWKRSNGINREALHHWFGHIL
ncbi:MAG: hypothetical protein KGS45_12970 [Planctomycetes bacterium]|nr:hypothetical protein [Planctomycetota bacterium]